MAEVATGQAPLLVTVVVCLAPRETREQALQLPPGSTVSDALEVLVALGVIGADMLLPRTPGQAEVGQPFVAVGVWGRVVGHDVLLAHLDRLEIYRPLTVDPKVARRERFSRQGARTTGLFARRRAGGKSGY